MKVFSQPRASDLAVPAGHIFRARPRKGAIETKSKLNSTRCVWREGSLGDEQTGSRSKGSEKMSRKVCIITNGGVTRWLFA